MRVLRSWLRDFVPLELPVDELVAVLDDLGLAVESVERVGEGLEGVVVARVLELGPIAGADRIQRVVVDAGDTEPVQVVCGAWNFAEGDLVPLATVGTVLPGGMEIGARTMKGVESRGMLCAADELGLPGGHDEIVVLPAGAAPPGTPFAEAAGAGPDVVLDLEVNANRPDAMSMAGVARDLAARLGLPFTLRRPELAPPGPVEAASVAIDAPDLCRRFVATVIAGVRVGPSPAWLADRLARAGMRPINNVVDASNYVMLELGQPTHPYDAARLGGRGFRVRRAHAGETLVTLDGVERALDGDLLICDAEDGAIGIAGIMGGASTEIDEHTTEVVLEAAWFDPLAISRSARRLKLRTEASARFEKGCDWAAIDPAVARFVELLSGGDQLSVGPGTDAGGGLPERAPVRVRTARVNQLLGTELTDVDIAGYLGPIGFTTLSTPAPGVLEVALPTWRLDSATEIDVVEEVARLHGYRAVPKTVPRSPLTGALTRYQRDRRLVRHILAGAGADEAWSTTFLAAADLERCGLEVAEAVVVANPLVAEESRLRTSLLPGLVGSVAGNARHRITGVSLFEVGHTFRRPPDGQQLPDEREMVAVATAGADAREAVTQWHLLADGLVLGDWQLEACAAPGLHPTRTARIVVEGEPVGMVGEVDPGVLARFDVDERVAWVELDLERLLACPHGPGTYRPISRYPSSDIDLAFEVDDATPAGAIERTLAGAGAGLVSGVRMFDVYRGDQVAEGRRSLAWTVRLQAPDRTLTDDEVGVVRRRLIAAVEENHGARLRG
ncbi:MAG: phenylalanine--tRNA ligase subunit beta [Actinobacteria bacterium]|nr:phenylalanine--tRNA ligase subunit beta [Actinomycetota bacterium]